jgi:cell division GTPase FtsZ
MSKATTDVHAVLDQVHMLLDKGNPEEALTIVSKHLHSGSKALINAYGVCLMRTGRSEEAVKVLRDLVYQGNTFEMRPDAPAAAKTNLATALLLSHRIEGCRAILIQMKEEEDPTVTRLESAIAEWKKSLSLFQRLQRVWGTPSMPVSLDFPPGDF